MYHVSLQYSDHAMYVVDFDVEVYISMQFEITNSVRLKRYIT